MEIALIGERHTVHGFRLAGIRRAALIDEARKGDMRALLKELFSGEVALLLITERVAEELGDLLEEAVRFKKGITPIVIEIPDSGGPLATRPDPIRALIKKTVGFEIA
ncbi:MAG: V-type ATP synthase subunit F [Deltaproteobacteria bacterium]|nr:V-type ATP synthase subunit F [Deltaproteobacteria bacterium]MBW2076033.1 V-type ATP synthase subunit F [Deltaproteobacteria bacterium]MBW2309502.1 V-type ATP synthase subunit F [Deltaproteobacteria bacterium]